MKKFIKVFGLCLVLVLSACGKDGQQEYVEAANEMVDIINTQIYTNKKDKEFNEKLVELEASIQKIDDLDMSEENEAVSDEVVKTAKELVACIKKLQTYNKNDKIEKYNKKIEEYNKLTKKIDSLNREIK
ncbi:ribosomal protein S15P/S13E [Bacilli bacterium PM5-3]|nr:ribosomal protein S15P/S13E [Bacilli bacterium PM5-3]MDH6603796.1 ribosomal protein S15P/S13E [Bacilli bacterium PM5-9]